MVHCSSRGRVSLLQEAGFEGFEGRRGSPARVCPKTGRNPCSGTPIIPLEIFIVVESTCNSALRRKPDPQTASLTLNMTFITQAGIFHHRAALSHICL